MRKTATTNLGAGHKMAGGVIHPRSSSHRVWGRAWVLLILLVPHGDLRIARGDRPGSYDNVANPQHRASLANQHNHATTLHHGSAGRYRHHSSIYFHVGVPSPLLYPSVLSYNACFPSRGWGYSYWNTTWNPTGIYYNSTANYLEYYLPPSYVPAELNYGPQALDRFLGIPRRPPMAAPAVAPAAARPDVDAAADAVKTATLTDKLRASNATTRQRARRFLAFGDALFLKQQFHQAAQRYRSAIETAPDLAAAYYRQGFALLAVKQYRLAVKALRIAVELNPEILRTEKLLHTLYGDNHLVKNAHLEQLADKALGNPTDGDMFFLVGVFLYANGEGDRAIKFLQKAVNLASPGASFLTPLLAPAKPAVAEMDT